MAMKPASFWSARASAALQWSTVMRPSEMTKMCDKRSNRFMSFSAVERHPRASMLERRAGARVRREA
jgi:hypothetical protein